MKNLVETYKTITESKEDLLTEAVKKTKLTVELPMILTGIPFDDTRNVQDYLRIFLKEKKVKVEEIDTLDPEDENEYDMLVSYLDAVIVFIGRLPDKKTIKQMLDKAK